MAWNDLPPGGPGNRNDGGPPDLDELWKKFNDRLNGMFGGKPGGANAGKGNGPRRTGRSDGPRIPWRANIGLVLALVGTLWMATGFYIVNAGERGVVLRFGRYLETTQPGPRWHLPWPIESAETVNLEQVRTVEVGYRNQVRSKMLSESLMLTDDENIIDLQFSVQYTLKDPEDFLFSNRSPDEAVMQVAESAMREIVGKSRMDYVLYEGRADIAVRATKLMQDTLDRYRVGVQISKVNLQNAQPPEQVQAAFDDAVKAGQDRERLKNEGQAYANDIVPKARGMAARLLEEAAGHKQRVINNAKGDADRFNLIVVEYQRAPQVTRERLYQDAMQTIMSNTTKVLVDGKQGGGQLLYLPLDKLMQMNAAEAVPAPTTVQPPEAAPAPAANPRDLSRGREREVR